MPLHYDDSRCTGSFDIGSGADQARIRDLADSLVGSNPTLPTGPGSEDVPLDLAVATMLARSKNEVQRLDWEGQLAVVFAMWGEGRRLRPRTPDNPAGEDAMVTKLDQLAWLFDGTDVDWSLVAVDDGDPDDNASVARQQADRHREASRVEVLRLADALPADAGPFAALEHVDDSRKGGAVLLGAQHAHVGGADAVLLTDADNSVNLGQAGLLLGSLTGQSPAAVVGDRQHSESILVKAGARWGPGIVVLRHMQRMIGHALFDTGLRDTQAAFKLFNRPALDAILAAPSTYGFSFDADWLYATITSGGDLTRVPFAFIDSLEESASITQGPMTTWESLLTGLVDAARAREADHDVEMAAVVDDYGHAAVLEQVVQLVPDELDGVSEDALGRRDAMSPAALRTWLDELTA